MAANPISDIGPRLVWWLLAALFTVLLTVSGATLGQVFTRLGAIEQTLALRETRITRLEVETARLIQRDPLIQAQLDRLALDHAQQTTQIRRLTDPER